MNDIPKWLIYLLGISMIFAFIEMGISMHKMPQEFKGGITTAINRCNGRADLLEYKHKEVIKYMADLIFYMKDLKETYENSDIRLHHNNNL